MRLIPRKLTREFWRRSPICGNYRENMVVKLARRIVNLHGVRFFVLTFDIQGLVCRIFRLPSPITGSNFRL